MPHGNLRVILIQILFNVLCCKELILRNTSVQLLSRVWQTTCKHDTCKPTYCSTPGFPVHHQLPEFAQTHVYRVSDTIQPSCPPSSPSLPAFNLSQHQGLFQWVSSSHWVAKYWSFSITPSNEYLDWVPLGLTGLISLQSKGLSRVFCNTTVQKYPFFSARLSLSSNSRVHTWLSEKP